MFNPLELLSRELAVFQNLSERTRSLTLSILLYQVADVIIFIFAYAFLFQQTQSFTAVALFNLGFYITLSFAFLLTTQLLKRFSLKQIAFAGLVGEGLVFLPLFLIPTLTMPLIFFFGLCLGIPLGFYWCVRHFLFTTHIPSEKRDYVSGIINSLYSFTKLTIPILVGWLIALSPSLGLPKIGAYQILAIIAVILFFVAGFIMKEEKQHVPKIAHLFLKNPPRTWKWFRLLSMLGAIHVSIYLALSESLIIGYLGDERVLGLMATGTNIFATISLYIAGRNIKGNQRSKLISICLVPLLVTSVALLLSFSKITIILYLTALAIFDIFFWFIYYPLLSKHLEENNPQDIAESFPYIIDNEIVINLTRIVMSVLYLVLVSNLETTTAIPIVVMVATFSQLGLFWVVKRL